MSIAYRREIDGLRAIAVASVVVYHARLGLAAGFVGVDIFFVISGYLITALLLREHASTGRIDLGAFYARRARRILPALVVVVAAVLAVTAGWLDSLQTWTVARSAGAAAVFLANVFFKNATSGYFTDAAETMPLLHLWSLSVEEQFYLGWPLLVGLALRRRGALPWLLAGVALCSFAWAEWAVLDDRASEAFYLLPGRAWELAVGGLVALLPGDRPMPRGTGLLAAIVLVDSLAVPASAFPAHGALPVVLAAAALIAIVHAGGRSRILASPPMVGLGLISYSLYLWHWPLLSLYRILGGNDSGTRVGLCALAALLAIGSWRYVESPFRRHVAGRAGVGVGLAVVAVLGLAAFTVERLERDTPAVRAAQDRPSGPGLCRDSDPARCGPAQPVVLWGDSMAGAFLPLGNALGPAVAYTKDACKAVLAGNATRRDCAPWARSVLPYAQRADTLLLAGRWEYEFFERDRTGAATAMRETLQQLRGVRRIIVLGPLPSLRARATQCLENDDLARCAIQREAFFEHTAADRATLQSLVAEFPNAEYLEVGPWFCDAKLCPATRGDMVLYYDQVHPSLTATTALAAELGPALKARGAAPPAR